MRRFAVVVVLTLAPGIAWAQASRDLNQDWIALNIQLEHVQRDMSALVAENNGAGARATDLESRLKWVLDNWVPDNWATAPASALPKEGKP